MKTKLYTNQILNACSKNIIDTTGSSTIYRLNSSLVLRRYDLSTLYYKIINDIHNNEFYQYLKEIASLDLPFLAKYETVYKTLTNKVMAVSNELKISTSIDSVYPKTKISSLISSLKELHEGILKLYDVRLCEVEPDDVCYTSDGKIRLTNLDLSIMDSGYEIIKENIKCINNTLMHGIFRIYCLKDFYIDDCLKEIYDATINGECAFYEFLTAYQTEVNDKLNPCVYYKDLTLNKGYFYNKKVYLSKD